MPRKFFKKYLPAAHVVKNDKSLRFLGTWLHDPNIWHLNRRSVSGAVAVGLFLAFVPFPFGQTLAAALVAILFRVNLPISAALVWITNPITMPPIYLGAIKLGNWILELNPEKIQFELSWTWVSVNFVTVWKPFVVGSMVLSVFASVLGYIFTRLLWRWYISKKYLQRKRRAKIQKSLDNRIRTDHFKTGAK